MNNSVNEQKKVWRKEIAERKKKLSLNHKLTHSKRIVEQVVQQPWWQKAKHVCAYFSVQNEVNTHLLIERALLEKKRVFLPKCEPATHRLHFYRIENYGQLDSVFYGIPEPNPSTCEKLELEQLDTVFVPGLIYDRRGYRIGYGGGYYDRFLQLLSDHKQGESTAVGLAFPFQIHAQPLPIETFDRPVDYIVTPDKIIQCSGV